MHSSYHQNNNYASGYSHYYHPSPYHSHYRADSFTQGYSAPASQNTPQAHSPKIFVGGLDVDITEEDLSKYFGQFGKVMERMIKFDSKTKKSRGFGFITFKDPESVSFVLNVDDHKIKGKRVDCKLALSKEATTNLSQNLKEQVRKVFVSNIPKDASKEVLTKTFESYGDIEDLNLMYKKKETGFCYIIFKNEKSAKWLIEQKTIRFRGHILEIRKAVPKDSREQKESNSSRDEEYADQISFMSNTHMYTSKMPVHHPSQAIGEPNYKTTSYGRHSAQQPHLSSFANGNSGIHRSLAPVPTAVNTPSSPRGIHPEKRFLHYDSKIIKETSGRCEESPNVNSEIVQYFQSNRNPISSPSNEFELGFKPDLTKMTVNSDAPRLSQARQSSSVGFTIYSAPQIGYPSNEHRALSLEDAKEGGETSTKDHKDDKKAEDSPDSEPKKQTTQTEDYMRQIPKNNSISLTDIQDRTPHAIHENNIKTLTTPELNFYSPEMKRTNSYIQSQQINPAIIEVPSTQTSGRHLVTKPSQKSQKSDKIKKLKEELMFYKEKVRQIEEELRIEMDSHDEDEA